MQIHRARGTVLIVDDDEESASVLAALLCKRELAATAVRSARECLDVLGRESANVVVTDVQMAGMSGIELCRELGERHPDVVSLVLTGTGTLEVVVSAMRAGAYDYLRKPIAIDTLDRAITRALGHRREVHHLRKRNGTTAVIEGIEGASPAIRGMLDLIRRAADSDATVLISGESGTGKELVARALHLLSPRRHHPFVAINCAAVPAGLLESELFGHLRGAFTDASHTRSGLFVQAGAGTIFLDELGEMPIEMQVKLLRVLQERKVRPVGGDQEVPFEARVIASTNRDLEAEVVAKRFRGDLFYRINVVGITVPPLRARGADILVLAECFLRRIAARLGKPVRAIAAPAARVLMDYRWPGNVRELENYMERAVALCRTDQVTVDDLPAKLRMHTPLQSVLASEPPSTLVTLEELEHRYVRQVIAAVGGSKTAAARVLGIDRRSVYRRLEAPSDSGPQAGPATNGHRSDAHHS